MVHMIADAHIYDRHVPIIEDLISRTPYDAPTFHLNPDIHDFYQFTKDDVSVENYRYGEPVKNIPIAI
jgi:thymidylate synthase